MQNIFQSFILASQYLSKSDASGNSNAVDSQFLTKWSSQKVMLCW